MEETKEKKLNFKWEYSNGVEMSINIPEKLVGKEEDGEIKIEPSAIILMMKFFDNRLEEISQEIQVKEEKQKPKIIMP